MFESMCALITPFNDDMQIDFKALSEIVERLINEQVDALVILGTTAETPTLNNEERWMLYNYITRYVNKRVKVYAGIGTNDTITSLRYLKMAMQANVDGLLIVTPYYNCPSQQGLYEHISTLAQNTNLPIILYNVKKRCGTELDVDTIIALVKKHKNIVGLKQAGGSYADYLKIKDVFKDFKLYSGDDNRLLEAMKINYDGIVSVAGNLYLPLIKRIVSNKDFQDEDDLKRFKDITYYMYLETSPVPIKYAMSKFGYCTSTVRLPLTNLTKHHKKLIDEFINDKIC